jgi:hypothetical protein
VIEADNQKTRLRSLTIILLVVLVLLLAACGGKESNSDTAELLQEATQPTAVMLAEIQETTEPDGEVLPEIPPTWTPMPQITKDSPNPTEPAPPTNTAVPTSTNVPPTDTPEPTATDTPEPTVTIAPTKKPAPGPTSPPAPPTLPPEPVLGVNLLPNASFEEGHYNQNGVPELQLPNGWRLEWDEGPTGFGDASWDVYVRPEARVLSTAFLPPEEHGLYIYNGQHTVKIFKGSGAVSFRLLTDVTLEPGTYVIEAKMFADIVEKWENRTKVWPIDPTAAEFHFIVGNGGTFWTKQNYGQINVHNWTFTVDEPQTITVGIALHGKYAISNNGWFIDDLSLRRVE